MLKVCEAVVTPATDKGRFRNPHAIPQPQWAGASAKLNRETNNEINKYMKKLVTMEDYLLSQLEEPVKLKDGSFATNQDGKPMTKIEAIATNILNQAMKGDIKAAQYISSIQQIAQMKKGSRS